MIIDRHKVILKNTSFVLFSQIISLVLSTFMSFFIPKFLGVEEFGYWQLFLFYCSYTGFFHFGLNDGIYLRYGGKNYTKINKSLLLTQFKIIFFIEILLAIIIIFLSLVYYENERKEIIIYVAIFMIVSNLNSYICAILQSCNNLKLYAIISVIDKFSFIIFILFVVFIGNQNYEIYIKLYIISKIISLVYAIVKSDELFKAKKIYLKKSLNEFYKNISVGILLLVSNISSMLILGIGRYFIDKTWGISNFGKLSLALSLTSFFLIFICQLSLVIFPILKQTSKDSLQKLFYFGNNLLNITFNGAYIFYPLIYLIIQLWIPNYKESIEYFIILLPLCLFDGKMQIIYNPYMKALRKEKYLLIINVTCLLISLILSLIGVKLNSKYFIIMGMSISICIRSIIVEIFLLRNLKLTNNFNTAKNVLIALCFWMLMKYNTPTTGFYIFITIYLIYLFSLKKEIKSIILYFKTKL